MDDRSLLPRDRALRRSIDDRMLGGVMGGMAQYFGMDSTLLRVIAVVISVVSAAVPGLLLYLLLWAIMPEEGE